MVTSLLSNTGKTVISKRSRGSFGDSCGGFCCSVERDCYTASTIKMAPSSLAAFLIIAAALAVVLASIAIGDSALKDLYFKWFAVMAWMLVWLMSLRMHYRIYRASQRNVRIIDRTSGDESTNNRERTFTVTMKRSGRKSGRVLSNQGRIRNANGVAVGSVNDEHGGSHSDSLGTDECAVGGTYDGTEDSIGRGDAVPTDVDQYVQNEDENGNKYYIERGNSDDNGDGQMYCNVDGSGGHKHGDEFFGHGVHGEHAEGECDARDGDGGKTMSGDDGTHGNDNGVPNDECYNEDGEGNCGGAGDADASTHGGI